MAACHCCCKGRPRVHGNATLWKIDVATGQLIWAADRGSNSASLEVVDEGGAIMIYEGGIVVSSTHSTTKWKDSGSGADRLWNFADTQNIVTLQKSDDNSMWLNHGATPARRIDEDGAEINSGTVGGFSRLAKMSNGNMNYWSDTAGVNQYDTTITSVASVTTGTGALLPLSISHDWNGNTGWIWNNSSTQLRHYGSDLSTTETFTHGLGSNAAPVAANSARVAVRPDGAPSSVKVYSLNPLTLMHTITPGGVVAANQTFDASNNFYISTAGHVLSYDDSGNQRWDRTVVNIGGFLIVADGMLFVRSSGANIDLDDASDNFSVARLDIDTGETMWGASFCRSADIDCLKKVGNYVYVCGARLFT